MIVATFDTYTAAKALRKAGFDERQAEAAVVMVRDAVTENVATRADFSRLEDKVAILEDKMATRADLSRLEDKVAILEDKMATRADLSRLEDKMATLEDKMATKADLAELKADMLKFAMGIVIANTALTVALIKLLP